MKAEQSSNKGHPQKKTADSKVSVYSFVESCYYGGKVYGWKSQFVKLNYYEESGENGNQLGWPTEMPAGWILLVLYCT